MVRILGSESNEVEEVNAEEEDEEEEGGEEKKMLLLDLLCLSYVVQVNWVRFCQQEVGNAGRHMQNAAGWALGLRKDGQDGDVTREAQPAWEGGEGEQLPLLDLWHSSRQV